MRQIRRLKTFSFNRWINTAYKTISEFLLFWPLLKYLQERGLKKKSSLSKSTNKPVLNTKPQNLGFRKKFAVISVQITTTSRNTTCKIHWALIQGLHKKIDKSSTRCITCREQFAPPLSTVLNHLHFSSVQSAHPAQ